MITMGDLPQYLLAYRTPGGSRICRHGALQTTIPFYPPGLSITWTIFPESNAYASIHYYGTFSPSIVPNTFWLEFMHSGMAVQLGFVSETLITYGHSQWMVITENDPATQIMTNTSSVGQYMEALDYYLIVDSEQELQLIYDIIYRFGLTSAIEAKIAETNTLLGDIATGLNIQAVPRSPVGRRV